MAGERAFAPGDRVRLVAAGYRGFVGVVSGYEAETERLKVTISIYGRETLIAVDPENVEKAQ
jgi:transcription antitermination factor NusG